MLKLKWIKSLIDTAKVYFYMYINCIL